MPEKDNIDAVSLPCLVDFDWRIDVISASNNVNRMSVPRCLLQLQVADKGNKELSSEEVKPNNVTVELSKETLETMLDGLASNFIVAFASMDFHFVLLVFMVAVLVLTENRVNSLPCGDPGPIHNGTIIGKPSYGVGGVIKFKCNKCFTRKGPGTILCTQWSHWTGRVPKCIPNTCPDLKVNDNEILLARSYGYEYHFQCDASSVLVGRATVRCTCSGRWSSRPPVCRPLKTTVRPVLTTTPVIPDRYCPEPEKLVNGLEFPVKYGNGNGFQPGDRLYFLCKDNYRLIGPKYRVCEVNSEWKHEHPYCQRKSDRDNERDNPAPEFYLVQYCPRLFAPINGEATGANRVGNILLFRCHEGYKLVGEEFTRCQLNGLWSKDTPICEPVCMSHECPVGKKCIFDITTSRPLCVCDMTTQCPLTGKKICANDGQTYKNKCFMNVAGCLKKKDLTKVADGPCQSVPVCQIRTTPGCNKKVSVYRYNWLTRMCEFQEYGTCHPSGWDGYKTKEECERNCKDVCSKKWDAGPCKASDKPKVRWLFYPNVNGCRPFLYFGCFGNANNFPTRQQCQGFCMRNVVFDKKR